MSNEYTFTLPIPPSANRYWRMFKNHMVVSSEAKAYKEEVFYTLTNKMQPLRGNVAVNFTVYRRQKSGDLDNFTKVLLDSLKGIAFTDDDQVVEIHAFRDDDRSNPRVEFLVYETTQEQK